MKFNKILQNREYTTKQALGYYILAFKEIKNNDNNKVTNYLKAIIYKIEDIELSNILNMIDTSLISDFPFYHSMDIEEVLSYAIVVFNNLIDFVEQFTEKDIVAELRTIMMLYSSRTILKEATRILNKIQNEKANV